ncbi:MAG: hypothetical protein JNJ61_05190, partial [Anaerolineae bacterium]|nr:hypothetical protein [Anaerolineae bacterium]
MMRRGREGLPAFLLVLVAMSGFGLLVWWNARPSEVITPIIPTEQIPTEDAEAWQRILQA